MPMILLDTHILVYLAFGEPIRFAEVYASRPLVLSPVSAAEVACLQRAGRLNLGLSADRWFEDAVARLGATVLPLSGGLLARAMLLEWEHRDPADRVLVQTVREQPGTELHTRDGKILGYAGQHGLAVRDCRL